ncbi:ArsR/SmtB family transcription factor [Frateuria aurantia]|uniref:Putative transcriptional regulator n=1 Tax=Frateuria aurantia (strain ATCC 33424 / DSM 6220 / KCTC 2777 / LMG 1558 / NBRC 3245 / NCIMB 13370) TaxID=767434 RepID=H8L432_FRAAD|nr:helix-turn-helix transcriptional regulator [Frateuria aurantia]AFC86508.1 putative transcriptional regulator [Frateuria aurantia DSM 6220]
MRSYKHPVIEAFTLERLFYALSDSTRLDIVRKLAGVESASCAALDGGRPKSSMSHHFRILREAGLVETRIQGTTHQNRLRREDLEQVFPGLLDPILQQLVSSSETDPCETAA